MRISDWSSDVCSSDLDAQGLDDDTMQAIARWTRLPETTFVFHATTPDADYRLRIFSPRHEVPFAGHPSVGTAHAVLEVGLRSEEHTSELQSLMRNSYAVFCLKKTNKQNKTTHNSQNTN